MSFERPAKGLLVIQCDACFDTREFSKTNGEPAHDYRACWKLCVEDGWSTAKAPSTDQLCGDCTQIAKADRANPFRK
jgi:hypothetical protein